MYLGGRRVYEETALIDVSEDNDLSEYVNIHGHAITGLIIPVLNSCNVTFLVSNSKDGTYYDLKDKNGDAVTITAGTGGFAVSTDDLTPLAAYRFIKVKTSASQSGDRTFTFILKV